MPAVPTQGDGGGAPVVAPTWTVVDLTTLTKIDPSGIEVSPPVSAGGDYYTISLDASIVRLTTGEMLGYYFVLPDVTFADAFTLQLKLFWDTESDTRLTGAAFVSDSTSALSSSLGYWAGLSEQNIDDPDTWVRKMTEATPSAGSSASDHPLMVMTYQHAPWRDTATAYVYDLDAAGLNPVGFDIEHAGTINTPASSGPVIVGVLTGPRSPRSASESGRMRLEHRVTKLIE